MQLDHLFTPERIAELDQISVEPAREGVIIAPIYSRLRGLRS